MRSSAASSYPKSTTNCPPPASFSSSGRRPFLLLHLPGLGSAQPERACRARNEHGSSQQEFAFCELSLTHPQCASLRSALRPPASRSWPPEPQTRLVMRNQDRDSTSLDPRRHRGKTRAQQVAASLLMFPPRRDKVRAVSLCWRNSRSCWESSTGGRSRHKTPLATAAGAARGASSRPGQAPSPSHHRPSGPTATCTPAANRPSRETAAVSCFHTHAGSQAVARPPIRPNGKWSNGKWSNGK